MAAVKKSKLRLWRGVHYYLSHTTDPKSPLTLWDSPQDITVSWLKRYGVSNHRQSDCLFNSLLAWYRVKQWNSASLAICEENLSLSGGLPSLRASYMDSESMSWRHHGDFTDIQSTYHIDIPRRKSLMGAVRLEFLFKQLLITWIRFQKLIGTCPAHIQLRENVSIRAF